MHHRFIVVPGCDPGISADSGGWGDPRIASGDDEDENSCFHLDPYPDAHGAGPGDGTKRARRGDDTKANLAEPRAGVNRDDKTGLKPVCRLPP
jgi:hypothetical protein